jgi:GDP-mannose 6-dehydrogenase
MNIGVFGLGYVGIVNVACFTKIGHTVWCTDVKPNKTALVAQGRSPINEPGVDELLSEAIRNKKLIATQEVGEVVRNCEVLIICVGTPSKPDGEVNLDYLNNVVLEIAGYLKPDDKKYLVFRSTVPPGTTDRIARDYLGNFQGIIPVFYPEFLRESSAIEDFFNYSRMLVGVSGGNREQLDPLLDLIHVNKEGNLHITDHPTAEYSKYIDNSFHALKVAFANEIFNVGAQFDIDVKTAHQIFTEDVRLNISSYYLRPGLPFGGSCLPKDLRELQYLIRKTGRSYPLLQNIIPSNDKYLEQISDRIISSNRKRVAFVGLSFKHNSDDLRESPALRVLNQLASMEDYHITVFDPDLNPENIRIDYPHLFRMLASAEHAMQQSDLVVITKKYQELIKPYLTEKQQVMDFTGYGIGRV